MGREHFPGLAVYAAAPRISSGAAAKRHAPIKPVIVSRTCICQPEAMTWQETLVEYVSCQAWLNLIGSLLVRRQETEGEERQAG